MTRPRVPSLVALRAFEAVGRTGSMRAAGDELAVSHTVVSRHIQNLQESLGVTLVRAQGRGVMLTERGSFLYEQLSQAFDIIARATVAVRPPSRTTLNIWCIPGIANRRLLQRLPELTGPPNRWEVNLQPTLSHPDLSRGEADAEIVYADVITTHLDLASEPLIRPRVFPVASPSYLARHPAITSLTDLASIALIHEESTEQWERWFRLAGLVDLPQLGGQRLWHAHLAIEAARLGQGVAIANDVLVEDDLRTGALVELLSTSVYMGTYQLVALKERWRDPAIVALRNWLQNVLASALIGPTGACESP
ncbi:MULTISPECIES: LysR substrate-binding domain-containing protein [Bradyrhizobium]|uniref:LysR substrate-binding domain-containing protein n=1 Tax=Bradyrhizobium TaxID=374 RepID=UPI0010293F32|nr:MULTISPECIES: LysR substrate-binding domain-containing protein [Bradyrhizobium]MBO4221046.1 LysR family transcriptional regulator [Bradyrhizobium neotropicale]RZN34859.1 LysR family transcriptional regulator [Bradyrhizobium sp. Leo121]